MDSLTPRTLHEELIHHNHIDPHKRGSGLSDFILGAQDGLVNVLGVALGIAAATNDARVVLVAGLATMFAESISMGPWHLPLRLPMQICIKASASVSSGILLKRPCWRQKRSVIFMKAKASKGSCWIAS
ncbi:MAG: VIT1/CCC1 transporter family protein [Chloroflexi bacterium]|nr:VIT1/CCC1 transporter family protein [Chloroflexota bacterium]